MEEPQNLPSVLVPLRNGQAILPQSVVVESLPFATPLRIENSPPWVVGAILWRARTTPLVSLEVLIEGSSGTDPGARSRIVVLNALGSDPKLPKYCILGTDMPRSISLKRSEIMVDEEEILRPEGVLTHVMVNNEECIIPNLDFIEEALSQVMRRKSLTRYDFRRSESSL